MLIQIIQRIFKRKLEILDNLIQKYRVFSVNLEFKFFRLELIFNIDYQKAFPCISTGIYGKNFYQFQIE